MNRAGLLGAGALALVVGACGSSTTGDGPGTASNDAETADDRSVRELSSHALLTLVQTGRVAAAAFDPDPHTIEPGLTPTENAEKVRGAVSSALGGCGSVTTNGDSITVSFGSGCTLVGADLEVKGTMDLALSKSGATTSVATTFTGIVASGVAIDGKATFSTEEGFAFSFNVDAELTSGARSVSAKFAFGGAGSTADGFIINGSGTFSEGALRLTDVAISSFQYTTGDCYPNGGIMTVKQPLATFTFSLSDGTASTGDTTVSKIPTGGSASTYLRKLPAYGHCGGG